VRLRITSVLVAKPCVEAELGVLDASGAGVSKARSALRPWIAPGAVVRFEARLSRLFAIDLDGGLRAPLIRETFVFQPTLAVYRPPALMFVGGAGLSVRFP
jgi:hypothetical protein